jgi:uncharacterized membrane protein
MQPEPDPAMNALALRFLGFPLSRASDEERHVLTRIAAREPLARDAAGVADAQATFGDYLADRVAAIGGSWTFIGVFLCILVGWMLLNVDILSRLQIAFDPYPFIFLSLTLSTLATIQAPIILMSQNRQAAKDRIVAGLDYEVNLRAELEILRLHEKLDQTIAARLEEVLAAQQRVCMLANAAEEKPDQQAMGSGT